MSAVAGARSIAYSADTAGQAGRIACQVIRCHLAVEGRVTYSIAVRNDTGSDANVLAFVPDALDLRHRTIVQSIIGAYSNFSTAVELELNRYGGTPELRVQLTGEDIAFAMIVPDTISATEAADAAAPGVALAVTARPNGSSLSSPWTQRRQAVPPRPLPSLTLTGSDALAARQRGVAGGDDARQSPAAVPMFAFFLALIAAAGIAVFRPQVRELTVPRKAQAATNIPVAYRVTGIGTVTYRVVGSDGDPLASGTLATGAGTFTVTLPKDRAERAYLVRVGISGVFGTALAEEYVKVPAVAMPVSIARAAPAVIAPPQIRSLALDRATLNGGDTLNVYYDVAAASGSVALLDAASQVMYGKSDLSPSGRTAFVLPMAQSERFLSVVVTARRGTASAVSRIAVTVEPQTSPTPQADASDLGSQAADQIMAPAPVFIAPANVRSGQPIHVEILNAIPGLVLFLRDNDGTQLASRHVETAAAKSSVTFTAPSVKASARVQLQVTYPQGTGSETIVKTIAIFPR